MEPERSKKLSYIHSPLKTALMYSTVGERLQYFAQNTPTKEACVVYDFDDNRSSITCYDLFKKSCNFARGLLKLGIKQGDIVATSLLNGPNWMVCTFGIQIAGAVPLLFKFYRHDGIDVSNALVKCGKCTAIIFDPGNDDVNLKISRCFIQEFKKGEIRSTKVPSLKYAISSRNHGSSEEIITIDEILQFGETLTSADLPDLDPDDLAAILLSSGSTGTPKPIQYTHINLLEVGRRHSDDVFQLQNDDIFYNANSFNWGGAYPHTFLFKGTTRVTCSDVLSFKSIEDINSFSTKVISQEKCTVAMISVPCIKEMIENNIRNNDWASSLRSIMVAGLPIPSSCAEILNKLAERLICAYGATEIGSISAISIGRGDHLEDYSVGTPFSGYEMKIVGDKGNVLPPNEFGDVYVRDCIPHLGYHNDKDLTEKVSLPNGWYKTDDVGCMRDNGTFIVSGRRSDMIIIGGELVSPAYLEGVIRNYPGVRDVVVVPIADDSMYQQACVCIIPKDGQETCEETMRDCFRKEFAIVSECRGFVPKYYLFFDAFPTTPLGKISRKMIQNMAGDRLFKSIIKTQVW